MATIKANHLTAIRILMLPLPCLLLYHGLWGRISALVIFALLGITDYLDGLLARRQGATSLGQLLDPIADKIFVAVIMIPLVDFRILPLWLVLPVFFRESLVTELRRFLAGKNITLKVTELAKIKTTIQMTGAGLIFMTDTFADKAVPVAFLSGALLATLFLAAAIYLRENRLSSRLQWAMGLLTTGLLTAMIFSKENSVLIYGLVIMIITLASAGQYFRIGLAECLEEGTGKLVTVLVTVALPLLLLSAIPLVEGRFLWILILVISIEFAVQGLDMWSASGREKDISWIKRTIFTPACILVISIGLWWRPEWLRPAILFVLVLTSGYAVSDAWCHRKMLLKS